MHYGRILNHINIQTHHENNVRSLAGQEVVVFPDTANNIEGFGTIVDVVPLEVPDAKPISIKSSFIQLNQPPGSWSKKQR